ncbi:MAG: alpha/beta fold hydrolase, partial [Acidimicrobiales bacterium]
MEHFPRDGLTFDVTDTGEPDGQVVVLLHGFPEDRSSWTGVIPALTGAGFRVLAPDLRGYSPGARPRGRRAYALRQSAADVLALADAAGADQLHVVGHDWGAALAWFLAARHPERVRTLSALSVPHTEA